MKADTFFHVFCDEEESNKIYIIGDNNKIPVILTIKDRPSLLAAYENETLLTVRDTISNRMILSIDTACSEKNPKIWYSEKDVNVSYRAFPSHVIEYQGKYFYWFDDTNASANIIDLFQRSGYVDTLVTSLFWPDFGVDDGKDMVSYTFKHSNLRRYKKRIIHGLH